MDNLHSAESEQPRSKKKAEIAASVALFGVILIVSVVLAVTTDLNAVVRGAIAIVSGLVGAAVTFILVSRRRSARN